MKRMFYFLLTNIAIMLVLGVVLQLLGVESVLKNNGADLDLQALLVFSAVFGMGGSLISLMMSKWMAKRMSGAVVIQQPRNGTEKWLLNTVQRLSQKAGIGMPEVAVFETAEINAFATGMSRNNALVAVSSGLLSNMSESEAEAVIGHEIAHVANGDMVTLTLIQGVVNTFVIFFSRIVGFLVDRILLKNERGHGMGYYIASFVAQIVFGILASGIVMYFSRWREYRADQGGAELAGRHNMIAALEKLRRNSGASELPEQMVAFGISAGVKSNWQKFFMSHPPLEDRIRALKSQR
ncbi:MAG: protease HtpX [Gammaproteobacteria bacterium]|nr:protease HtpX [Gammaproteobacteria bacterium]